MDSLKRPGDSQATPPHNLIRLGISLLPRLTLRQYGLLILFVVVSICAAVLEVASGAALALLASLLGPAGPGGNLGKLAGYLESIRSLFASGPFPPLSPALFCGGVLLAANFSQVGAFYLKNQISMAALRRVRASLASYYFTRRLGFYSQAHSSEAIAAILTESQRLYFCVIAPVVTLFHSGFVALMLAAAAIWVNPRLGLMAAGIFIFSYIAYYFALKPVFQKSDKILAEAGKARQKILQQGFEGMREFLFWGKRDLLLQNFIQTDARATRSEAISAFFAHIPRNVLEILIILSAFGIWMLVPARALGGVGMGEVVFYGFAMLRILPAMQHIFASVAQLQMGRSALVSITRAVSQLHLDTLEDAQRALVSIPPPKKSIALRDVHFSHQQDRDWAIRIDEIKIKTGSMVAFIGPTGAGKSTTVDILAGLEIPQSGGLWVDGRLLEKKQLPSLRRHMAYLPQNFYLLDASVEENIALGSHDSFLDKKRAREAARAAHIDDFVLSLPRGYAELLGERGVRFSGGQRQRLGLARALYSGAPILVLDEPTSALDPETEAGILETLAELRGRHTIILITHRESAWKQCDEIYFFKAGTVRLADQNGGLFSRACPRSE